MHLHCLNFWLNARFLLSSFKLLRRSYVSYRLIHCDVKSLRLLHCVKRSIRTIWFVLQLSSVLYASFFKLDFHPADLSALMNVQLWEGIFRKWKGCKLHHWVTIVSFFLNKCKDNKTLKILQRGTIKLDMGRNFHDFITGFYCYTTGNRQPYDCTLIEMGFTDKKHRFTV